MLAISKTGFFAKKNADKDKNLIPRQEIRLLSITSRILNQKIFFCRATVSTAHSPRFAVVRIVIESSVRFRG